MKKLMLLFTLALLSNYAGAATTVAKINVDATNLPSDITYNMTMINSGSACSTTTSSDFCGQYGSPTSSLCQVTGGSSTICTISDTDQTGQGDSEGLWIQFGSKVCGDGCSNNEGGYTNNDAISVTSTSSPEGLSVELAKCFCLPPAA